MRITSNGRMVCEVCGVLTDDYNDDSETLHELSPKHLCNEILSKYLKNKKSFTKNKDGVDIMCNFKKAPIADDPGQDQSEYFDNSKIRVNAKPNQMVTYQFQINNIMNSEDLLIVGVQLAHDQLQFKLENNKYVFGGKPKLLAKKTSVDNIFVSFKSPDIGQYEMPIMFTFVKCSDSKNMVFVREMVVMVRKEFVANEKYVKSPYTGEGWQHADHFLKSNSRRVFANLYVVPPMLKKLLPWGLEEHAVEKMRLPQADKEQMLLLAASTRELFDEGLTKDNYVPYFRHLLWWEEIVHKNNLRKYNMKGVTLKELNNSYFLEVPGLAEKRPSLLRGMYSRISNRTKVPTLIPAKVVDKACTKAFLRDKVCLRAQVAPEVVFEGVIDDMDDNVIQLTEFNRAFETTYRPDMLFDVQFTLSRGTFERMHEALTRVSPLNNYCRIFPQPADVIPPLRTITRYFNKLVSSNAEQMSAVRHILSKTSGKAPYMVFGPPGTGKTITIVEAILQIVMDNPANRVLVCTDSNMAADHVALTLLKYKKDFFPDLPKFLLRANSQSRVWSVLPPELHCVSNGTCYRTFYPLCNSTVSEYRIVVTTLLHAAKYCSSKAMAIHKLRMSHLFIDEAAQASEPASLVPLTGLLAADGQLVLAGDPEQLGPVCSSQEASNRGLSLSLMERLKNRCPEMYDNNSNYITMLVKNWRSHKDILTIPNELFYDNRLEPLAAVDPLSEVSILGEPGCQRAIGFHAVSSKEQRMGDAPSYYNDMELDVLKLYIKALLKDHNVAPRDIGVIAPYIRQVYKVKTWLAQEKHKEIEVGTVESYQGKEKRVILVTTVRANCRMLDYDAKFNLGFLVDDKRFNVTLTRAKAKLVIVGNPACLSKDIKWRRYMALCREYDSYAGYDKTQPQRSLALLTEMARVKFTACRLTEALAEAEKEDQKNKQQK